MSPNLERISIKARANPDLVFTSLYHHIADIEHLQACFRLLKGNKAVGVDDVTKSMYADDLEANLQDLSARLKRMGYRPQPKRRVYIPTHSIAFLRNKNAALPARAQKSPLTLSGLKKHGSRLAPAATNFRAPSECQGCRRTG